MIGVWGQGLTEELFDRDTRSPTLCVSSYQRELANIAEMERIRASGDNEGFQTYTSKSNQEDRRAAAVVELKKCNERTRRIAAINAQTAKQDAARRVQREAEAQATLEAQMGLTTQKRGFNPLLLGLLAIIPIGFLLFRRKK